MIRMICKSKINYVTVTHKNIKYSGSIEIDKKLLEASDILPNEIVLVVNVSTGARFETYVIEGKENSGVIGLQGGAARLGEPGDKLIIISYCLLDDNESKVYKPKIINVDDKNRIKK